MGVRFLARGEGGEFDFSDIIPGDVVILPAFGVTMGDFERLRGIGCVLVDTTCGSVLNVWKRVEGYARDGYTAIIHGKHYHEETKATASQVMKYPGGRYLVVLDMAEARIVCDFIERGGDAAALAERFARGGLARVRFRAGPGAGRDRQPDDDALGRVARDRRGDPPQHGAPLRHGSGGGPLPLVRHDLLRHAGAAGCGGGADGGAARRDGGGGRLQLEQHLPSGGAGAVEGRPHLSYRGRRGRGPGHRHHPAPADRHPARGDGRRLARRRAGSSGSPPARRRRTTRSARRSRASARWPAWRRSSAR